VRKRTGIESDTTETCAEVCNLENPNPSFAAALGRQELSERPSRMEIPMAAPAGVYRARRATLAARIERPLAIFAGHAPARSYATNLHRFRAACSFLYFGGPPLEDAALMIEPGSDGDRGCHLFRVPPGPDDDLWLGPTPDRDALAAASGIEAARIHDEDRLAAVLAKRSAGALIAPHPRTIARARALHLADATDDEKLAVIAQRLIKDEHELAALRKAADVVVAAHRAAMSATRSARTESDIHAAHEAELTRHLCVQSFSTICTIRGEVLHGACAGRPLAAGGLLLLDAGAEEPTGYCSDITRTWPVGGAACGAWSEMQRTLYDAVLAAQVAAVAACKPGARYLEIHHEAARHVCAGLVAADLLRGSVDELVERGAYGLFFAHGVGHLLGLGVHDLEEFGDLAGYATGRTRPKRFGDCFLRLDRDLAEGMVVTIEPGIYLVPAIWRRRDLVEPFADVVNRSAVEALLDAGFGGIRIEDDVHVCADGPEVLTRDLPKDGDEISALLAGD
jgi:Xaa-Pro aminopeptidase